jgi:hypothetical protein
LICLKDLFCYCCCFCYLLLNVSISSKNIKIASDFKESEFETLDQFNIGKIKKGTLNQIQIKAFNKIKIKHLSQKLILDNFDREPNFESLRKKKNGNFTFFIIEYKIKNSALSILNLNLDHKKH